MEGVKTKSGRKVHRPTQFDPAARTPTRRRGPYRRFHDSRICRICQRGHSPQSNMIVFCDGCNIPYHQLCHDPPIDDLVIAITDTEWFCRECSLKRTDLPPVTGMSGASLTEGEKRVYLTSLPHGSLVELLLFAEKRYPELPLYDPNAKVIATKAIAQAPGAPQATPMKPSVNVNGYASPAARGRASIDYEELIIRALAAINDPVGVQPKFIWEWLKTYSPPSSFSFLPFLSPTSLTPTRIITTLLNRNYTYLASREVRAEGQNPLQKLLRLKRIIREGHQYRVNYSHPQNSFVSPSTTTPILPRITAGSNVAERARDATSASEQGSPTGLLVPGAGIKLPPEIEDDAMLVDDEGDRSFSHKWMRTIVSVVALDSVAGRDVVMADGREAAGVQAVEDVMS